MSVDDVALAVAAPAREPDLAAAVTDLIAGMAARRWGQVSPSVYETARLVTLAPWLSLHEERVAYLLKTQRPDGRWGAGGPGYLLVPTLSAIEALLAVLNREPARDASVPAAAARGLRAVFDGLGGALLNQHPLPDMPAIELIVPSLAERIDRHLAALADRPVPGLEPWAGRRLALPASLDGTKLGLVRNLLESGSAAVPQKFLHALEVAGDMAVGLAQIRPEPTGTIGASPAATAAWLGDRPPADPSSPARWHLETVAAQHGGPVPCGYPLTVFERGWALAWLIRAGLPVTVHPALVLSLTAPFGPAGTPAADGLPADADTTSGALYALALLGAPHRPDPLLEYELETHFCTWQGEDGVSLTTNAHVLEAFGQYLAAAPAGQVDAAAAGRYAAAAGKAAGWLRSQQRPDGSWEDRWHASPYYATACCVIALAKFGGPGSVDAVAAARRWLLATQRPDGSWGRWEGTPEETAYAVQSLLLTSGDQDEGSGARAAARGRDLLLRSLAAPDGGADEPALWHDKDLYRPGAIVRAAVLAALALLRDVPRVSSE